ncbi:MAG: 50S ribosomal protein L17 [Verrucomicrobiota bacterium]
MRHRKFTFKIGRSGAHRKAMLGNMVCSLFREQRIRTTVTKAKQARRLAERMITLGKNGRDHDRRRAVALLRQPDVVATLFTEIAPRFQDRQGGYTRMVKIGPRKGDAAEMCLLELVSEPVSHKAQKTAPAAVEAEAPASELADESAAEGAGEAPEADASEIAAKAAAEAGADAESEESTETADSDKDSGEDENKSEKA